MSYDRKAGGAYVSVTGRVRHISVPERTLVMEDGTVILIDDIAALNVIAWRCPLQSRDGGCCCGPEDQQTG